MIVDTKIDLTGYRKIAKEMQRLQEREVATGFGTEPHNSGLTVGALSNIIENGVRARNSDEGSWRTKPRPFMEQGKMIWATSIERDSADVVKATLQGKNSRVNMLLHKIGESGENAIQQSIEMQNFAALKPSTIALKIKRGSAYADSILLDTSELFQSSTTKIK